MASDDRFNQKAPVIMRRLMDDFGLNEIQAAGILGNLGHECAGFTLMQEVNPVGGGRGGFGWAQWTGPRRRSFETWCSEQGFELLSDEGNYGYLKHELETSEKGAINAVKQTTTLEDAVQAFEQHYERAGVKHYESREKWAQKALQAYRSSLTS